MPAHANAAFVFRNLPIPNLRLEEADRSYGSAFRRVTASIVYSLTLAPVHREDVGATQTEKGEKKRINRLS